MFFFVLPKVRFCRDNLHRQKKMMNRPFTGCRKRGAQIFTQYVAGVHVRCVVFFRNHLAFQEPREFWWCSVEEI